MPKNTAQCPWLGLEPGQVNPEASALTMRPLRCWYLPMPGTNTYMYMRGHGVVRDFSRACPCYLFTFSIIEYARLNSNSSCPVVRRVSTGVIITHLK